MIESVAHNDLKPCYCSPHCTATTHKTFAPGHDQRLIGWLKRMMELRDDLDASWARREAISRGATAGLMTRLEITIKRGGFE